MDYSGYNPNQPQPQQQQSYYEYDPSQIQLQPYDQSYATAAYQSSYYAAYNQSYASYYPTDSTTSQLQQQQQPINYYQQSEPAPVHPPGVNPEPVQLNNLPVNSFIQSSLFLFHFYFDPV
jgi:hypothetical protein